jgi:hypothetical protein
MKSGIVVVLIIVLALMGAFATVASASSSITTQIIKDASDGTVNGNYTASQVRAALAVVNSDPAYSEYSDVAGVLEAYLTSLSNTPAPSSTSSPSSSSGTGSSTGSTTSAKQPAGQLAYTGGQPFLALALGGALVTAGVVLRRRRA